MARNLLSFANRMEKLANNVDKEASATASRVAIGILTHLVHVTPVDTSKALSNWQVSLNEPVSDALPPYYEGKGGSTKNSSAQATLSKAKITLAKKKPGESIYLSNVLPYIQRLNDGHSQQAPVGFVELSVALGRRLIKQSKGKL
jgi:hypothetical protein